LALLAVSIGLLYKAARQCFGYKRLRRNDHRDYPVLPDENPVERRSAALAECWRDPGIVRPLIAGALLLLFTLTGRYLIQFAFPAGQDEPASMRVRTSKTLTRSDGTNIHAELYGRAGAPTLVLTHGWGTSGTEWYYAKRHLSDRFRLIVWDLPGLGESAQRRDRNFALEQMASDLHKVLSLADGKPVILVGHSIGGMINLTFCRLHPELSYNSIRPIPTR
jgi:hypothetical protein